MLFKNFSLPAIQKRKDISEKNPLHAKGSLNNGKKVYPFNASAPATISRISVVIAV